MTSQPRRVAALYTKHLVKKQKTWHDGHVLVQPSGGAAGAVVLVLRSEDGATLGSARLPALTPDILSGDVTLTETFDGLLVRLDGSAEDGATGGCAPGSAQHQQQQQQPQQQPQQQQQQQQRTIPVVRRGPAAATRAGAAAGRQQWNAPRPNAALAQPTTEAQQNQQQQQQQQHQGSRQPQGALHSPQAWGSPPHLAAPPTSTSTVLGAAAPAAAAPWSHLWPSDEQQHEPQHPSGNASATESVLAWLGVVPAPAPTSNAPAAPPSSSGHPSPSAWLAPTHAPPPAQPEPRLAPQQMLRPAARAHPPHAAAHPPQLFGRASVAGAEEEEEEEDGGWELPAEDEEGKELLADAAWAPGPLHAQPQAQWGSKAPGGGATAAGQAWGTWGGPQQSRNASSWQQQQPPQQQGQGPEVQAAAAGPLRGWGQARPGPAPFPALPAVASGGEVDIAEDVDATPPSLGDAVPGPSTWLQQRQARRPSAAIPPGVAAWGAHSAPWFAPAAQPPPPHEHQPTGPAAQPPLHAARAPSVAHRPQAFTSRPGTTPLGRATAAAAAPPPATALPLPVFPLLPAALAAAAGGGARGGGSLAAAALPAPRRLVAVPTRFAGGPAQHLRALSGALAEEVGLRMQEAALPLVLRMADVVLPLIQQQQQQQGAVAVGGPWGQGSGGRGGWQGGGRSGGLARAGGPAAAAPGALAAALEQACARSHVAYFGAAQLSVFTPWRGGEGGRGRGRGRKARGGRGGRGRRGGGGEDEGDEEDGAEEEEGEEAGGGAGRRLFLAVPNARACIKEFRKGDVWVLSSDPLIRPALHPDHPAPGGAAPSLTAAAAALQALLPGLSRPPRTLLAVRSLWHAPDRDGKMEVELLPSTAPGGGGTDALAQLARQQSLHAWRGPDVSSELRVLQLLASFCPPSPSTALAAGARGAAPAAAVRVLPHLCELLPPSYSLHDVCAAPAAGGGGLGRGGGAGLRRRPALAAAGGGGGGGAAVAPETVRPSAGDEVEAEAACVEEGAWEGLEDELPASDGEREEGARDVEGEGEDDVADATQQRDQRRRLLASPQQQQQQPAARLKRLKGAAGQRQGGALPAGVTEEEDGAGRDAGAAAKGLSPLDVLAAELAAAFRLNEDQAGVLRHVASWFARVGREEAALGAGPGTGMHVVQSPVCLVHGPFGSGKSTLLACVIQFIVRARDLNHHHDATSPSTSAAAASLNAQAGGKRRQAPGGGGGKATAAPPLAQRCRVLVAAHTNVAVDRVLLSLQERGFTSFLRVGSLPRMARAVLPRSLHAADDTRDAATQLRAMLAAEHDDRERLVLQQELAALQAGAERQRRKALASAPVVGTTCAALLHSDLWEQAGDFPIVVLDEASQITEPTSLVPLLRAKASFVIVAGDPMQLPPVVANPPRLSSPVPPALDGDAPPSDGLLRPLFVRLQQLGHVPHLLRTQYRCHPSVSALPNQLFYGGRLRDGCTAAQRAPLVPLVPPPPPPPPASPLGVLNGAVGALWGAPGAFVGGGVGGGGADVLMAEEGRGEEEEGEGRGRAWLPALCVLDLPSTAQAQVDERTRSTYNLAEARYVAQLVCALLAAGVPASDIGVICLYRAQVAKVQAMLALEATPDLTPEAAEEAALRAEQAEDGGNDAFMMLDASEAEDGREPSPPPPAAPAAPSRAASGRKPSAVQVATVDSFQGAEKEVVLVATSVTSAEAAKAFASDPARLNVALTRAKRHLLLLGACRALSQASTDIARIVSACRRATTTAAAAGQGGSSGGAGNPQPQQKLSACYYASPVVLLQQLGWAPAGASGRGGAP